MEYSDLKSLFEEAQKVEDNKTAAEMYEKIIDSYIDLIKKCYLGDKNYHVKYKLVDRGKVDREVVVDFREEYVEAIVALSKYEIDKLKNR